MKLARALIVASVFTSALSAIAACAEGSSSAPPDSPESTPAPTRSPAPNHPVLPKGQEPRAFKSCIERLHDDSVDRDASAASPRDAGADATLPISDADKTIAALRPQFRRCYQKGLEKDPRLQGCIVMNVRVLPDGTVHSAAVEVGDGLGDEVNACLVFEVSHAKFSAPGGAGSILHVPVTFLQPH